MRRDTFYSCLVVFSPMHQASNHHPAPLHSPRCTLLPLSLCPSLSSPVLPAVGRACATPGETCLIRPTTHFSQPIYLQPCQHGTGRANTQGSSGGNRSVNFPLSICLNVCLCCCMRVRVVCMCIADTHIRTKPTDQKPEDQMLSLKRNDTISNFLRYLQTEVPLHFAFTLHGLTEIVGEN